MSDLSPFTIGDARYYVPVDFFTGTLKVNLQNVPGIPQAAGGFAYTDFASRIMNALGTTTNRAVLSLISKQINNIKQRVSLLQVPRNSIPIISQSELWLTLCLGFLG